MLIAAGGGMLFSVSGRECDDCDTAGKIERFSEGIKNASQIGYLLIALGGICLMLGI